MSQYMNGANRIKGWSVFEDKVLNWLQVYLTKGRDILNAQPPATIEMHQYSGAPLKVKNIYNPSQYGESSNEVFFGHDSNISSSFDVMDRKMNTTKSSYGTSGIQINQGANLSMDSLSDMCGSVDHFYIGDDRKITFTVDAMNPFWAEYAELVPY